MSLRVVCLWCEEEILSPDTESQATVDVHQECMFRMVSGSAAHLLKECSCYGGDREDPPGFSKREAALLSLNTWKVLYPDLF